MENKEVVVNIMTEVETLENSIKETKDKIKSLKSKAKKLVKLLELEAEFPELVIKPRGTKSEGVES